MNKQWTSAWRSNMANPRRRGTFVIPEIATASNDDNIKALDFAARPSGSWTRAALLSDQTIWATIARIVRQSGA